MKERVVRCPHCGLKHDVELRRCPATGLALDAELRSEQGQAQAKIPNMPPVRARSEGRPASPSRRRKPGRRELIGRVIGDKYGVLSMIGEGGMGSVFEAEHLAIGRRVAVKVIHPEHAGKREAVSRLQHEARVVGTIGHPNICEIYDMGRLEDGSPYLVMERLHGETMAERIKREGKLSTEVTIDVVSQVLSALIAAHTAGIIHRDLKPDNIFLAERAGMSPLAKLLDFGISKAAGIEDSAVDLTRTGMVMGTPYYMAPEQARGDRDLDPRVDLWAVGVVLYEALSGRRPFLAKNYNALLVQILTVDPRPLEELLPNISRRLADVITRAVTKLREDRFQSAKDFQEQLRRCVEGGSKPASSEMARADAPEPRPRSPSVPQFAGAAADLGDQAKDAKHAHAGSSADNQKQGARAELSAQTRESSRASRRSTIPPASGVPRPASRSERPSQGGSGPRGTARRAPDSLRRIASGDKGGASAGPRGTAKRSPESLRRLALESMGGSSSSAVGPRGTLKRSPQERAAALDEARASAPSSRSAERRAGPGRAQTLRIQREEVEKLRASGEGGPPSSSAQETVRMNRSEVLASIAKEGEAGARPAGQAAGERQPRSDKPSRPGAPRRRSGRLADDADSYSDEMTMIWSGRLPDAAEMTEVDEPPAMEEDVELTIVDPPNFMNDKGRGGS